MRDFADRAKPRALPDVLGAFLLVVVATMLPGAAQAQWQNGGVAVCTAPFNQQYPFIIGDGAGGAFIAWADERDSATTSWDIYVQRLDASGAALWTADGVPVCTVPGIQEMPHLVRDGSDGVIVAWNDFGNVPPRVYAQRLDASGVPQWTASGVQLSSTPYYHYLNESHYPCIVPDGEGGAIVTWGQVITGTNEDIYAQRVDASGVLQWGASGVPVCTAATFQLWPTLIAEGAGGAIIVWEDFRDYPTAHVYGQRLGPTGSSMWPVNGVRLSGLGGDQRAPVLVSDGGQGAIVTFTDYRPSGNYTYAQRVNAGGSVQWGSEGVPLSTESPQSWTHIVSDSSGGAVVAWALGGQPYPVGNDLHAQRVNAAGAMLWGSEGVPVCTYSGNQEMWTLVPDLAGGAIAVWRDGRRYASDGVDTYVQHLDGTGAAQWEVDGMPLVAELKYQLRHVATSDGAGGAIVAWADSRNGFLWAGNTTNLDIYAARVGGLGVVDAPRATPSRLRVLSAWPNPTHSGTSIAFALPSAARVTIEVFDVTGGRVRTLVDSLEHGAGTHTVAWDGRDRAGHRVAGGVYLVRLFVAGETRSRRIVIFP